MLLQLDTDRPNTVLLTRLLKNLTCLQLPDSSFCQRHKSFYDKIDVSIRVVQTTSTRHTMVLPSIVGRQNAKV